jgi:predicted esterase
MVSNNEIILNPTQTHEGTVIFLHGLGDTGIKKNDLITH